MNEPRPLRILQIGHGRFGREHHAVWRRLADEGLVSLAGIVVNSERSRQDLAATVGTPVYCGLEGIALDDIDAVDIVTPGATHFDLVNRLLPQISLLVEKPLAATAEDADALARLAGTTSNVLAVGHIYRFHPIVIALRQLVAETSDRPEVIFGTLLNPADEAPPDAEPSLEMLHLFDVIDMLFGVMPVVCSAVQQEQIATVSLRYPEAPGTGPTNAVLRLGWEGHRKRRSLELVYRDRSLQADLIDQTITIDRAGSMRRIILPHAHTALEGRIARLCRGCSSGVQIRTFSAATGARIVGIARQVATESSVAQTLAWRSSAAAYLAPPAPPN